MSYDQKIESVSALVNKFNASLPVAPSGAEGTEPGRINFHSFQEKLKAAGGFSEETLAQCSWEDLQSFGLPKLIARQAAAIFRVKPEEEKTEKPLKESKVAIMSLTELLNRYDPAESEHPINKRLASITQGQRCIVFGENGKVHVPSSEILIQELKDGYAEREYFHVNDVPQATYRINERPNDFVPENPMFEGEVLRCGKEERCHLTNRRWDTVDMSVRQLIRLAIKSGELSVQLNPTKICLETGTAAVNRDAIHLIMDNVVNKSANASFDWISNRAPKARLHYQRLIVNGDLPKLMIPRGLKKNSETSSAKNNPFGHKKY